MIRWTIKRVMDAVDQPERLAASTTAARKAMVAEVEAMIADQPDDVKAATRATIPPLAAPGRDRRRQFAVYLGGDVMSTTYVLVDAVLIEMYPGGSL
jgi:hypothetical protein